MRLRYLDRLFRRKPKVSVHGDQEACIVAFASGKGGTGKSFLATNVAVMLHRRGLRVTLVDCDFGLGNAHLLFGVNPRLTMQHLLTGKAQVEDVVLATQYGPQLVSGGSGISRLAELSEENLLLFARSLARLAANQDVLILDTAAGITPQSLITLMAAHHLVVITNPEIAALTDAYAVIKCLGRCGLAPPISVVLNRVASHGQGRAAFDRLSDVSRRFARMQIHYLGDIPEDSAVTHRRLGQAPLLVSHPRCETSNAIDQVLRTLETRVGRFGPTPAVDGRAVESRIWRALQHRS